MWPRLANDEVMSECFTNFTKKKYPDWIIWCSLVVSSDEEIPHWTLNHHHYCCWCCIWFLAPLLPLHASWRTWLRTSRSLRSVETLILILCLLLTRLQDLESKKIQKFIRNAMQHESHLEWAHESLIHWHHSPGIVELSAVVGSWEESDQLALGEEFVSILHNLRSHAWWVLRIINSFQYSCLETGAVPASTLFTSLIFLRTLLELLESNQCNVSLPQYWQGQFLTFHISRNWFVIMFVMIIQD